MTKRRGERVLIVASFAAIAVTACGRVTDAPPSLPATPKPPPPAATAPPAATPAPPIASDEEAHGDTPKATHAERPDPLRPMTRAEESNAMPKPGQANDHSNPSAQPVPTPRQEPAR